MYHTSAFVNLAIIFVLVYIILHSSILIVGRYLEDIEIALAVLLVIAAFVLLEISLVTTHRSLVNHGWR